MVAGTILATTASPAFATMTASAAHADPTAPPTRAVALTASAAHAATPPYPAPRPGVSSGDRARRRRVRGRTATDILAADPALSRPALPLTTPELPVDGSPTEAEVPTSWGSALEEVPGGTAQASASSEPSLRGQLYRVVAAAGRARAKKLAQRRRERRERQERRRAAARRQAREEAAEEAEAEPVEEVSSTGSVSEVVYAAAGAFGVDGAYLLSVAECESGLDPGAVNPAGYYGLFQFDEETWAAYGDGSIFDATAQARAAAELIAAGQSDRWPNCA